MIQISKENKEKCCGCGACAQKCPKQCISMLEDEEGFLYPHVDVENCVNCHICEKVCPFLNIQEQCEPLDICAAVNINESERIDSSSGGVFVALAKYILNEDGVVFGAVFDKSWEVHHVYAETIEDVYPMMGSKYVQSRVENSFQDVDSFLKKGRKVLFVGSPCQVKGLLHFLKGKDVSNLLAVEFLCHGVPSPGVWRAYLNETFNVSAGKDRLLAVAGKNTVLKSSLNAKSPIGDIKFREKSDGWEKFRFVVSQKSASKADQNSVLLSDIHYENPYMQLFLSDQILRPSCYACQAKNGKSHGDFVIGDYWGIKNEVNDFEDKGVSLVVCYSRKGRDVLTSLDLILKTITKDQATAHNGGFKEVLDVPANRSRFFKAFSKGLGFYQSKKYCLKIALRTRVKNKIKSLLGF